MNRRVQSLKVENFRNHTSTSLDFNDRSTILITGNNGSGKTSLLEAIHLCLRGKSFRTPKPEFLLRHGEAYCRAEISHSDASRIFYYDHATKQKTFIVGSDKKRTLSRTKNIPTIIFESDDLILFQTIPGSRRKYLDNLLGQIYPKYVYASSRYRRAITQRNTLLKAERPPVRDELLTWDKLLVRYGLEIVAHREKIIASINERITSVYQKIANGNDNIEVKFTTEVLEQTEGWWQNELINKYPIDRAAGRTTFGSQHDDMVFYFNGEKATNVASRGEVRTLVLALKFIEAEIVEEVFGSSPIILLDDVFSELDETRQKTLLSNFKNNQIFITATHPPQGLSSDFTL
ncbi:DNA replication and repair protein RecF [Candidatus Saccharibacteria bacterium]|nr:DNA replication and repair protein RecF [Candidatus Saccharibacteria bacterium]